MSKIDLIEELYRRLEASRKLLKAYDDVYGDLSDHERGYRTGINEEILWLEQLLNKIEKS